MLTRRLMLTAAAAIPAMRARSATPTRKLRVMMNYFASGEQGCFFQAQATGMYQAAGLDVEILPANPQTNVMQLLAAGEIDLLMGKDIQVLTALEKGVPTIAVCALFQFDSACFITRSDVGSIPDLRNHRIMLSSTGRSTYWPWLKRKYGFTEEQAIPYTGNLQPFFADQRTAVMGVTTGEPYRVRKTLPDAKVFVLADAGYPSYGAPLVARPALLKEPELLRNFLRVTMQGWNSYFADPTPAFAAIRAANTTIEPENLAFAVDEMRRSHQVDGGDAKTMGLGIMTEIRWQRTRDFLLESGLLDASTDWRRGFTTEFISDLHVMPA